MPKIKSEKIDCLHRPCLRSAPRGKIKSVRTHSEVSEQFDSFSLLKLLFLVRNWHCWSRKAFTRQMTPQIGEKTVKTAVFRQRWQAWKVVRSIAAARQRPRTPLTGGVLSLFSSLSFDISIKNSMQRWSSDFQGLFCVKIRKMAQGSNDLSTLPLRFSLWLIRYFLTTFVYTLSTPCRDVKFCPNIPLGDLSWNSLTKVMWLHHINGFSNSKIWKNWPENVHLEMENYWSGSFVFLYGWNQEDVRWDFSLFKSIEKLWTILSFATSRRNLDSS